MVTQELIDREFFTAVLNFPGLCTPEKTGAMWKINGCIDVVDDEGGYWDTYQICILIPPKYPHEQLPILVETGGKIEKHPDWHNTHSCCLSTQATMFAEMGGQPTLIKWLTKYVHPFLANHVYKCKTGKYAHEEFEHDSLGILQGYQSLFRMQSIEEIIKQLRLLTGKTLGRNDFCFCNSGKKLKHCYLKNQTQHTSNIPISVLENDLIELIKLKVTGR